jgi:hypothetical protein
MEQFNKKIYSGPSLTFFYLALIAMLNLLPLSSVIAAESGFENVSMKKFISPKYNEETNKLEFILTGKAAKTIGAFIKITFVKLDIIGSEGKNITGVVTTPEAFFNRATQIIKGDKPIHYQSLAATIDGVGFDCSMKTQLLHIRKNVRMLITSTEAVKNQSDASPIQTDNTSEAQTITKHSKKTKINEKNNLFQTKVNNSSTNVTTPMN